jgi:hypothetical protein
MLSEVKASLPPASAAGLLFDPKHGGDMLIQTAGPSLNYITLQPKTLYPSNAILAK